MKQASEVVLPIPIVSLQEIVKGVASGLKEEESNENLRNLLNMFAKHGSRVLGDLSEERLQDRDFG